MLKWTLLGVAVGGLLLVGLNARFGNAQVAPFTSSEQEDSTANSTLLREVNGQSAEILSAFFGLDNGLPPWANLICRGAAGADGMPVIFAHEIDFETLQPGDFRVTTASGEIGEIYCVTLAPAIDPGELRTVLLVGEFGSADDDPPVSVEIVGNLHSLDGTVNFKGAEVSVTPLEPGPTLVLAENLSPDAWHLGRESDGTWGSSCGCPEEGVLQVVRVTWDGGITLENGDEPGEPELDHYSVTVQAADGTTRSIHPFALGDLEDGDNNHELCLDTGDKPLEISFPAGIFVDPNGDLNPETTVLVHN
ncbi:MAG: hypothetical protein AB1778_03625 [Candidatus Bipolaricaulota bacterium]